MWKANHWHFTLLKNQEFPYNTERLLNKWTLAQHLFIFFWYQITTQVINISIVLDSIETIFL